MSIYSQYLGIRLELVEVIGQGGEGEVWSTSLPEWLIKVYNPEDRTDDFEQAKHITFEKYRVFAACQFNRVAEAECLPIEALWVRHPSDAEVGLTPGYLMKRAKGKTLESYVPLHEENSLFQRLMLARSLARSISILHGLGVVHADIKPDNFLVYSDVSLGKYLVQVIDIDGGGVQGNIPGMGGVNIAPTAVPSQKYRAKELAKKTRWDGVWSNHNLRRQPDLWSLAVMIYDFLVHHDGPLPVRNNDVLGKYYAAADVYRNTPAWPKRWQQNMLIELGFLCDGIIQAWHAVFDGGCRAHDLPNRLSASSWFALLTQEIVLRTKCITTVTLTGGRVQYEPSGIEVDGQQRFEIGSQVSLLAVADNGYHFIEWRQPASITCNPLVIDRLDRNLTIEPVFGRSRPVRITVTCHTDCHGEVIFAPKKTVYYEGETVVLAAAPRRKSIPFIKWEGLPNNAETKDNMVAFVPAQDEHIRAFFGLELVITCEPDALGQVSVTPKKSYYCYGDKITLVATPLGRLVRFLMWQALPADALQSGNTATFEIKTDLAIKASFARRWAAFLIPIAAVAVFGLFLIGFAKNSWPSLAAHLSSPVASRNNSAPSVPSKNVLNDFDLNNAEGGYCRLMNDNGLLEEGSDARSIGVQRTFDLKTHSLSFTWKTPDGNERRVCVEPINDGRYPEYIADLSKRMAQWNPFAKGIGNGASNQVNQLTADIAGRVSAVVKVLDDICDQYPSVTMKSADVVYSVPKDESPYILVRASAPKAQAATLVYQLNPLSENAVKVYAGPLAMALPYLNMSIYPTNSVSPAEDASTRKVSMSRIGGNDFNFEIKIPFYEGTKGVDFVIIAESEGGRCRTAFDQNGAEAKPFHKDFFNGASNNARTAVSKLLRAWHSLTNAPSESTWSEFVQALNPLTRSSKDALAPDIKEIKDKVYNPYQVCALAWNDYTNNPSPTAWQALEKSIEPFEQKRVVYEPAEIAAIRTNGFLLCRSVFVAWQALKNRPSRNAWEGLEDALRPFERKGGAIFEPKEICDIRTNVYWPYLGYLSKITGTNVKSVASLNKSDEQILSNLPSSPMPKNVATGLAGLIELYRRVGDASSIGFAERKLGEAKAYDDKCRRAIEKLKTDMQECFANGNSAELEKLQGEYNSYKGHPYFDHAANDLFTRRLRDLKLADEACRKAGEEFRLAETTKTLEQWQKAKAVSEVALKVLAESEWVNVRGADATIAFYKSNIDKCSKNAEYLARASKADKYGQAASWEVVQKDVSRRTVSLRLRVSVTCDAKDIWTIDWGDGSQPRSVSILRPGETTVKHDYQGTSKEYLIILTLKSLSGSGASKMEKIPISLE